MAAEWFYGSLEGYTRFIAPVSCGFPHRDGMAYAAVKRGFDLVAALGGLALLLPLFPFIVFLIKLETPGPVFFRQQRVGRRGRLFACYKFRSMSLDAEARKASLAHLNEATGSAFKIKDDPRITGVGRFLRRSSLDEFPQLFNVLRGEMSVVGPRPQIPGEVAGLRPRAGAAPAGGARIDLPVAGLGPQPPGFRRMDGAGPAVRAHTLPGRGPAHPAAHPAGGHPAQGGLLMERRRR